MAPSLSRRSMLTAPALLTGTAAACSQAADEPRASASSTLVAYFTRSGNTKVIAGTVQRLLGADLFEIRPQAPYPEDYEETVRQATAERDSGFKPALAATVVNASRYTTLFLAFPIWGETTPPIIRSFLSAHDLSGVTVHPLITHGGYGLGNSLSVLRQHAPSATIGKTFSMEADQERRTLNQVKGWLSQV